MNVHKIFIYSPKLDQLMQMKKKKKKSHDNKCGANILWIPIVP